MTQNVKIRRAAQAAGVRLWQIAAELGVAEGTFTRHLRRELPPEEQAQVLAIIDRLEAQRKGAAV